MVEVWDGRYPLNVHKQHIETHLIDVTTDSNGDGTAELVPDRFIGPNDPYFYGLSSADAGRETLSYSNPGRNSTTIEVTGGPASSTVTVSVLIVANYSGGEN